jgi:predicted transcriptional regulator of viral defense system
VDYVDALVKLSRVTAEQWGLVTAEQAEQAGVDASCLAGLTHTGVLVAAEEGVFQLAGAPLPSHLDIKVAWLQLEPGRPAWQRLTGDSGVVSHSSACRLHGLGDLPAGTVEMFAASGSRAVEAGVRLHHEPGPDPAQITVVDGLPVTTAGRTIADLLRAGLDGGHVGGVVADAVRCGLVDLRTLAQEVAVFAPAYGLPASASGHDLISHLLADAGEQVPAQLAG